MNQAEPEGCPPPIASVLFVDDELAVLQALVRRMRKEPFELRTATSAHEALGILARSPIDLVVSDMNMPGMTGMEFLTKVAKEYPECVRIMLTGKPTLDVAMGAINHGAVYRFLAKPYDSGALAALIREALEQRDARRTNGHRDTRLSGKNSPVRVNAEHIQTHFSIGRDAAQGPASPEQTTLLDQDFFRRLEKPDSRLRIQHYDIKRLIGKGAMGMVLLAHDPGLVRDVAIKVLAPELANSPVAHQRFEQEARCAAAIRHENVVTVFAVSEVGGTPLLVMEYVPGDSLQDRLDAGESFAVGDAVRIGRQVAQGLAAAHQLGVIHRDIKPANILLDAGTGSVRITDFGLARAVDCKANLSQHGLLLGTPMFMSPEQVDGKPLTPATDLFSLGIVLFTLCAGKHPFASSSLTNLLRVIAEANPPPLRSLNPSVPPALAEIIHRLLAKDPAERLPAATALVGFAPRGDGGFETAARQQMLRTCAW
jgi:DNA-binding response OmpR family regulator